MGFIGAPYTSCQDLYQFLSLNDQVNEFVPEIRLWHSVSRFVKLAILKLSRQSGGKTVDGNILQTCVPKPTSVGLLSY